MYFQAHPNNQINKKGHWYILYMKKKCIYIYIGFIYSWSFYIEIKKRSYIYLWTPYFHTVRSYSMTRFIFYFIWWKIWFFRKYLESLLIFVLFLNGKQNKKENSKCDSLFRKGGLWKTKSGLEGQVIHREGTVKTVTPL